jgi:excinuclease ABC subunit B
MKYAIDETLRRRAVQEKYNEENGITPTTIIKSIESTLVTAYEADYFKIPTELDLLDELSGKDLKQTIQDLEGEMRVAARDMKFERAAELRDKIKYLKEKELQVR